MGESNKILLSIDFDTFSKASDLMKPNSLFL